jgi:membrane protein
LAKRAAHAPAGYAVAGIRFAGNVVRCVEQYAAPAASSLLFTVGKVVIGFYLGHSALTSACGAAASLVIFLIWIYYSAQILLFGAELTHVCALKYG